MKKIVLTVIALGCSILSLSAQGNVQEATASALAALMQTPACREFLSEKVGGGAQDDDYFYSYYLRPSHTPSQVVAAVRKAAPQGVPSIYMSFGADPWPLMFYINSSGYPVKPQFDGPWGKVRELPAGSYVVLRNDENPQEIAERFNRTLVPFGQFGRNQVYSAQ